MRKAVLASAYIPSLLSYSVTAHTPQPVPTISRITPAPYALRPRQRSSSDSDTSSTQSQQPTAKPLPWLWQCHLCLRTYALGTTRRCLEDGHYFCSGESCTRTRSGRVKKSKSCATEFDYCSWGDINAWRRRMTSVTAGVEGLRGRAKKRKLAFEKKNCWLHCDYPSECRWQAQIKESQGDDGVEQGSEVAGEASEEGRVERAGATTFDEILGCPAEIPGLCDDLSETGGSGEWTPESWVEVGKESDGESCQTPLGLGLVLNERIVGRADSDEEMMQDDALFSVQRIDVRS